MANKKKILFVMWSFSLGGGAEKILSTIVSHLDLTKYDVDILEMEHFDKGYESVPEGVRILRPYKKKSYGRIIDALMWRARIIFPQLIRNLLVKDNYDIEVSFTIMNPAFPYSKRPEVKKIAWIHGSIEAFLQESQSSYRENHRQHLGETDKIVAISKKTRTSIETVYPEYKDKIMTIYNGYDFQQLQAKANEKTEVLIPSDAIAVVGRIEPLKGTEQVLTVFEELLKQRPQAQLFYIGSGIDEERLKELVRKKQLTESVHFMGYQKNPYPILKQMSVLLSLSRQEGFSGAVVEAVGLGVPFVSTDVGGAEELSSNGTYGTVIESDKDAIPALLSYLSKEKTIGEDYQQFIQSFTIEKQLDRIHELFEERRV